MKKAKIDVAKITKAKQRGKRSPRRWAQKLAGSIINHRRPIIGAEKET